MLRGALLAGGAVGVFTVLFIGAVGAVQPFIGFCLIWLLGLSAGLGAVWLGRPAKPAVAAQGSALAGGIVAVSNYVGLMIGAMLLRFVVAPSGLIPLEYLPSGINADPALFFVRDLCLCGAVDAMIIVFFSLLGGMALFAFRSRQGQV